MREERLTAVIRGLSDAGVSLSSEQELSVAVGFSGGADSSFLLFALREILGAGRLLAMHLHHGIRGAEADRDEDFCRRTADSLGVRYVCGRADIPALAAGRGVSLETAAREERYAFFERTVAAEEALRGGRWLIATAHTADDQLETLLFRLLRGSGTRGLGGIEPLREGRYVRPLLSLSGAWIREACRTEGIPYVVDSTNSDTGYTRNYLRETVIPALRRIVPAPEAAAVRTAELCREDEAFLSEAAERFRNGRLRIPCGELAVLPRPLASRVLRTMYGALYDVPVPEEETLGKVHTDAMLALVSRETGDAELTLPGGNRFRISGRTAFFSPADADVPQPFCVPFIMDGETLTPGFRVLSGPVGRRPTNVYNFSTYATLFFDTMTGQPVLRSRREGDVIRSGGMTRSVRKLLSALHLTREEREAWPLLCGADGETVLWVPGYPPADCCRRGSVGVRVTLLPAESSSNKES